MRCSPAGSPGVMTGVYWHPNGRATWPAKLGKLHFCHRRRFNFTFMPRFLPGRHAACPGASPTARCSFAGVQRHLRWAPSCRAVPAAVRHNVWRCVRSGQRANDRSGKAPKASVGAQLAAAHHSKDVQPNHQVRRRMPCTSPNSTSSSGASRRRALREPSASWRCRALRRGLLHQLSRDEAACHPQARPGSSAGWCYWRRSLPSAFALVPLTTTPCAGSLGFNAARR